MILSFETNLLATVRRARPSPWAIADQIRSVVAVILPCAAFHLLCLWTRSAPELVANLLGGDGFDAGFGLWDQGDDPSAG